MKTLETLFLDGLAEIYYAEKQLAKALPKVAHSAANDELREALDVHIQETQEHSKRVEDVFAACGVSPRIRECAAINGLILDAEALAREHEGHPTINAAIIAAVQRLEHHEIASYGTLREWAEQLAEDKAAELLNDILEEEKAADAELTELAREQCNITAELGDDDEMPSKTASLFRAARTTP